MAAMSAPHPQFTDDRLAHWAQTTPDRTWMAQRVKNADGSLGDWRHISYREAWDGARRIAPLVDPSRNRSASFQALRTAVMALGAP